MSQVTVEEFISSEEKVNDTILVHAFIRPAKNSDGIYYGFSPLTCPKSFIPNSLIESIGRISTRYCITDNKRMTYAAILLKRPSTDSEAVFFDLISSLTSFMISENNSTASDCDDVSATRGACGCTNGCIGVCSFGNRCTGVCY